MFYIDKEETMKKLFTVLLISGIVLSIGSCKKDKFTNLEYASISTYDWLQANVQKEDTRERVLWFQVFDQVENQSIVEGYKSSRDSVAGYPAKIFKDKWIWLLVNNRIEIRLLAEDTVKDFQDTEKLKEFIKAFDLNGMEKIRGDKVDGKNLQQFIPKL